MYGHIYVRVVVDNVNSYTPHFYRAVLFCDVHVSLFLCCLGWSYQVLRLKVSCFALVA